MTGKVGKAWSGAARPDRRPRHRRSPPPMSEDERQFMVADGLARAGLTKREAEIVAEVRRTGSCAEAARQLGIVAATARVHWQNALRKVREVP